MRGEYLLITYIVNIKGIQIQEIVLEKESTTLTVC